MVDLDHGRDCGSCTQSNFPLNNFYALRFAKQMLNLTLVQSDYNQHIIHRWTFKETKNEVSRMLFMIMRTTTVTQLNRFLANFQFEITRKQWNWFITLMLEFCCCIQFHLSILPYFTKIGPETTPESVLQNFMFAVWWFKCKWHLLNADYLIQNDISGKFIIFSYFILYWMMKSILAVETNIFHSCHLRVKINIFVRLILMHRWCQLMIISINWKDPTDPNAKKGCWSIYFIRKSTLFFILLYWI